VQYITRSLLTRRAAHNINVVNSNLALRVEDHAGQCTHGTRRKQSLRVFFADERPALLPLPAKRDEVPTDPSARPGRSQ
jgi:hypothetical protein